MTLTTTTAKTGADDAQMVQIAGQQRVLYLSLGWDTTPEEIAAAKPAKTDTDKIGYRFSGSRRRLSSTSPPPIPRPSPSSGGRRLQTVWQQLTPAAPTERRGESRPFPLIRFSSNSGYHRNQRIATGILPYSGGSVGRIGGIRRPISWWVGRI